MPSQCPVSLVDRGVCVFHLCVIHCFLARDGQPDHRQCVLNNTTTSVKNRRALWLLSGLAILMFSFGFALVPLYGLICQLTGSPSVEQRITGGQPEVGTAMQVAADRWITVQFDSTVQPDLPWALRPLEPRVQVHPGETREVRFLAENHSSQETAGQAIPSIIPWQATGFFHKLECFCFRQQTLKGGETKEMPLRFVVSPDLPSDVDSIRLSYSFMRASPTTALAVP